MDHTSFFSEATSIEIGLCKAQLLYTKQQFTKGVQSNITDFLKPSVTKYSIKIFSITFCTLVKVYCTCNLVKDAFRIVLYVTPFYMQHCAVACSIALKLLKDSVFVLCINNFQCRLTMSMSLVLATEHLKL